MTQRCSELVPGAERAQGTRRSQATPACATGTAAMDVAVADDVSFPTWASSLLRENDLEVAEFSGRRGVKTLRSRRPGEVGLSLPDDVVVTAERAASLRPDLAEALGALAQAQASSSESKEALTEEVQLALYLLLEKFRPGEGAWSDYVKTLPAEQPLAFSFGSRALQPLPGVYRNMIAATEERLSKLYRQAAPALEALFGSGEEGSWENFKWAATHVRARSVRVTLDRQQRALIPVLDLFNHHPEASATLERDGDSAWKLFCHDEFSKDSEVYITYGQRDNMELLLHYGFATPRNSQEVFFDAAEVLDAYSRVLAASMGGSNVLDSVLDMEELKEALGQASAFGYSLKTGGSATMKNTMAFLRQLSAVARAGSVTPLIVFFARWCFTQGHLWEALSGSAERRYGLERFREALTMLQQLTVLLKGEDEAAGTADEQSAEDAKMVDSLLEGRRALLEAALAKAAPDDSRDYQEHTIRVFLESEMDAIQERLRRP
eukprot:TRINITY_DN12810_c0_g1_i2.p1 TRINITY_DN12810_c0_g1~~TRINITY_DN12810_c0_g1_i2.p1  ORF type:complete len:576 (-),score=143.92 TRINITY_DN12810_c0_g1_i2:610-2088(-)